MTRLFLAAALAAVATAAHAVGPGTIDPAGLKKEVAKRKGKVVVVNFWASWCGPCKAEFPDLVKLYTKNKARGLELVTVAFDDKPDVAPKVVPFLSANKLSTGTFVNKNGTDFDPAYLTWLEPKLGADASVAIPRTYVFDRKGKLAKVLIGGQTPDAFEKAVRGLL
jgi:thiol-disulfide isomerase/thioredoxin